MKTFKIQMVYFSIRIKKLNYLNILTFSVNVLYSILLKEYLIYKKSF